jgi:ribose transport system ATP-binding protein
MTATPRIAVRGLCKSYPGVCALGQVDLDVSAGEVLAVVGENGAGKSTLMKTLAGNVQPDAGQILIDGHEITLGSPAEAIRRGIALIHQELNLSNNLSIAENILLGREPNRFGWIDRRRMNEMASEYLAKVGLGLSPKTPLETLSVAQKQMVEIAKALSTQATVLIMDEPTSSLSHQETLRLFTLVDELRSDGVSVIYISHRLGEVLRLANRVEVLRDGKNAGSLSGAMITHDAMVRLMVGRDPRPLDKGTHRPTASVRLEIRDLVVEQENVVDQSPVSLKVCGGEITVLAGLIGSGRSELLETIFGVRDRNSGTVLIEDKPVPPNKVGDSIAAGLALVSEDRKATGLLVESSVRANTTISAIARAASYPFTAPRWEKEQTALQIESLAIKTASQLTTMETLSGGNQQKIAIAKWLIQSPKVLLLDEPTRGVDIAARQEIYHILLKLAQNQVAILAASSDMEEVIAIADRVIVMHEGRIQGELVGEQICETSIMQLAVGGRIDATTSPSTTNP